MEKRLNPITLTLLSVQVSIINVANISLYMWQRPDYFKHCKNEILSSDWIAPNLVFSVQKYISRNKYMIKIIIVIPIIYSR